MTSLPLHPLFVHIPVVLIPLVLLLALPTLVSRRWFQATAPFALGLSLLATAGGFFATASGEALEEAMDEPSPLLAQHVLQGEMARNLAALTLALLLVQVLLYWNRSRAGWLRHGEARPKLYTVLSALVVAAALAATVFAVMAGHAGAQLVWQN